ncbi:MAG: type IV pilus twitching motility protein PilT [Deltaproteobacteria bacterium]|nr:type IV pilus twitching motility protein PilT [Deltaproteobacteria bacterium]
MELNDILAVAVRGGASDIHFKAGLPPMFRVHGTLLPLKDAKRLNPEDLSRMALSIMNNFQREKFKQTNELDLSYGVPGLGRFRVNVFQQRGTIAIVFRVIPFKIRSFEELQLPPVLAEIALESRGLILVTGTTGSGKSTTLAAMIDHINNLQPLHIITVEDPIEFLHRDKRSIVNQREIGVDTVSFAAALKSALRQDPDVILVGEMRDLETTSTAITAAETGHLVMSTVHTLDATETINRIVSIFPPHQQKTIRMQLGAVLRAIISQRLIQTVDGKGRVVALEILRNTARIRELIEDKDRAKEIVDALAQGSITYGMQTFDQSLMALYRAGTIAYDVAKETSSNPGNFELRVRGISSTSDSKWDSFEQGNEKKPPSGANPAPREKTIPGRFSVGEDS